MAIPCVDDHLMTSYLNDPAVKKALHIRAESPERWEVCSDEVNKDYIRTYQDLTAEYSALVSAEKRVLLYNGDVDMACNFMGDEWFVDSLGFKLTEKRRSWLYLEQDGSKQIGGYVKRFVDMEKPQNTSLTFVTIRGSGHMAPTDKPLSTYRMYQSFILNTDL
ncbi:hypothetical protein Ciccas_001798 [Cichlidogyrus casuarinus]|uniref:Serine carboxypeptidase n=1 Tax=Cichlidogyrus casuarinus TaxID=1844966 RepID=A0ABD2QK24_9PLAT